MILPGEAAGRNGKAGGSSRRRLILAAGAILLVAGAALAVPSSSGLSSTSTAPGGTLALRRFLTDAGRQVSDGPGPPSIPGTFILLSDLRNGNEADGLLTWVANGGRLVVADPASTTARRAGVQPVGEASFLSATTTLQPGCATPEALGVRSLAIRAADQLLASGQPRSYGCFPGRNGSYEVVVHRGQGSVIVLGGTSSLTNEYLRQADDGAFALNLVGTTGPVVFGPPLSSEAERQRSLWALLPNRAKAAIVGLCLAAALFALMRGRRLGRPVIEEPLSPIPAGELVHATGRLYRRARAAGYSGRLLRETTVQHISHRLGLPAEVSTEDLQAAVAQSGGLAEDRLRRAFAGQEPASDEELIALSGELEEIRRQVEAIR